MNRLLGWVDQAVGVPPAEPGTPGDPGLFGPGSAVWRVGRERVLLLAGQAALLLQIAHPLVAAGVAAHSDFRRDPFQRLRATLAAVLAISFGDREQAERAAAAVGAVHARVRGRLSETAGPYPAGTPYDATDPELAMWVHATLVLTALDAFGRLVRPLGEAERAAYIQESRRLAVLFGVAPDAMLEGAAAFDAYVEEAIGGLWVGETARGLARDILRPDVPAALRPAASVARLATAALLPERVREAYGLPWGLRERTAFGALRGGVRATIGGWPAAVRYWPQYLVARRRMRDGA
jgi:uncharacterized protein (DUF2236 family)